MQRFAPPALLAMAREQTPMLAVSYGAGVAANICGGGGAAGGSPFALGVAIVIGMLVRFGRPMSAADAAALVVAHAFVAALFGIHPVIWLPALAGDIAASAIGASMFLALRKTGRIASQPDLATAACLTGAAAAFIGVLVRFMASGADLPHIAALFAAWSSGALPVGLGLIVILTYGRNAERFDGGAWETDRAAPSRRTEYLISGAATAALGLLAIADGRPTSILAASIALLWFALRYGIFQTATAAFAFATALLAFGVEGVWPGLTTAGSAAAGEFSRAVSAAMLTLPSVFVAAVVSDQRRLKMIYAYEASHDGLTRLANRTRYNETLERAMASARDSSHRFVLMLIDLDHFKSVNDSHGHAAGDSLLIEVANRLRQSLRATDLVARLGGDEFAVIAPVSTIQDAITVARRLVLAVNQPWDIGGVMITPSITLGGVVAPDNGTDRQAVMLLADEALYEAKRAGRNTWRFSSGARMSAQDVIWVETDGRSKGEFPVDGETVLLD